MPIPEHDPETGYLPPGDHYATLDEVVDAYSDGLRRTKLCVSLRQVVEALRARGVTRICVDGGFISSSKRPSDVDVWYEPPDGADPAAWDVLSPQHRGRLRSETGVDLCMHPMRGARSDPTPLPDFWRSKYGVAKGLIWLREDEP